MHIAHAMLLFATQADLADRDFAAERGQAVVIINHGAVDPLAEERNEKERREAEERHRHRLRLPRRPAWTPDMSAEELDLQVWKCREGITPYHSVSRIIGFHAGLL